MSKLFNNKGILFNGPTDTIEARKLRALEKKIGDLVREFCIENDLSGQDTRLVDSWLVSAITMKTTLHRLGQR